MKKATKKTTAKNVKKPARKSSLKKAVLVTTEFRGVFFGYVKDSKKLPAQITLSDVRNVIYWHESVKGVFGLAATGPNAQCKLGAKIPELTVYKVTSVSPVTKEALEQWEKF